MAGDRVVSTCSEKLKEGGRELRAERVKEKTREGRGSRPR